MTTTFTTQTIMTTDTDTSTAVEQQPTEAEIAAEFDKVSEQSAAARNPDEGAEPLTESLDETPPEEPAAASAEQPAATTTTTATPAGKKLSEMSREELEAHANKTEHERIAAVGRAAALQRQQARASRPAASAPPPAALPEAERLENAFPDLDAAVNDRVERRLAAERAAVQQQIVDQNLSTMNAMHPGWFETVQSDQFSYWLTQQPPEVQAKFESNSVADYANLLTSYKAGANPSPTPTPATGQTEAERLAASRAQRTQQQQGLPRGQGSSGDRTAGEAGDPESLFNQLTAREDLKRERSVARR